MVPLDDRDQPQRDPVAFSPDAAFIEALRRQDQRALGQLFDGLHGHVERVLLRVLGRDHELADLVHEVFVQAMTSLPRLRGGPEVLRGWVTAIAVNVARNRIRHRRARRWLLPWSQEVDEPHDPGASPEVADAVRRVYEVLEGMPADERIPFALRHFDHMELTEIATACGTSLATVKRRLVKARERFERRARKDPVLAAWATGGGR